MSRFSQQITRLEIHISGEDCNKTEQNDKRCMIEVRLKGMQPIAVTDTANSQVQAVKGATDKLKNSLRTILGRLENHQSTNKNKV
ncbi:MAG: HPF/RaiA family ribosome-associated protein [Cyclobacteriaceae bacterium]|nr:HPF/RaiA family ribosome-associated protein [Cyclobacteriaceae bacterium]